MPRRRRVYNDFGEDITAIIPRVIPNCVDVIFRYGAGTDTYINTYHYFHNGPSGYSELLALATEFAAVMLPKMQNLCSQAIVFKEVEARDINAPNGFHASYIFPTGTHGTRVGGTVATSEACWLTTRTNRIGHRYRGGKNYSGFWEGDVDGNTLGSYLLTQIASIALSVLAARVGGTFTPTHASLKYQTTTPLLAALTLDNNVDSQKTRLNNRGR